MKQVKKAVTILRLIAIAAYMLCLLFLSLMFGFWQGLGMLGILFLFGWGMNLEQSARTTEEKYLKNE